MRKRDAEYTLSGIVELEDTFFGAPSEGGESGPSTEKTKVLVGLFWNKQGYPLYVKWKLYLISKGKTLIDFAEKRILPGSIISSDAYHSYRVLASVGFEHEYHVYNAKETPDHLNRLHNVLSNGKALG